MGNSVFNLVDCKGRCTSIWRIGIWDAFGAEFLHPLASTGVTAAAEPDIPYTLFLRKVCKNQVTESIRLGGYSPPPLADRKIFFACYFLHLRMYLLQRFYKYLFAFVQVNIGYFFEKYLSIFVQVHICYSERTELKKTAPNNLWPFQFPSPFLFQWTLTSAAC